MSKRIDFDQDGILTDCNIPFKISLIPKSHRSSRSGNKMTPKSVTVHNTGNPNADAEDNTKWVDSVDQYTSWHFTIGNGIVYQELPIYENAWHCGDGANGQGNRTSIGVEVSEEEGAYETAVKFFAYILEYFDWTFEDNLFPHKKWSGKNCPRLILPKWDEFKDDVNNALAMDEMQYEMKKVYTTVQKFDFLGLTFEIRCLNIDGRVYINADNLRTFGLTVNYDKENKTVVVRL